MTVQERLEDISSRCGMTTEVIRRVLNAEAESVAESLRKGERATLIGRCTIVPSMGTKLDISGDVKNRVKLSSKVTGSLKSRVDIEEFEQSVEEDLTNKFLKENPGVRTVQIKGLM